MHHLRYVPSFFRRLGGFLAGSFVIFVFVSACGSDDCGALTKICQTDGTTCACAPACSTDVDCASHSLCHSDGTCEACGKTVAGQKTPKCSCEVSACTPFAWQAGDMVSFK